MAAPRDVGSQLPAGAGARAAVPLSDWEYAYPLIGPQIDPHDVHIWPFDPALPLDVSYFVRERGRHIPMNHHDYFEISFIHSGSTVIQIGDRSMETREGDVVVIGAGVRHHVTELRSPIVQTIDLYFVPSLICAGNEASADGLEYLVPFQIQDHSFPHVVPGRCALSDDVLSLMLRIAAEATSSDTPASRLCLKTYLKMILALLVKHYSGHPATAASLAAVQQDIRRLQPVFNHIDNHYSERITVGSAARLISMSEPHFMRFFKHTTQHSFLAYLNEYRLAKAQSLLASTDQPIAEISQEVGFYDQSHFGMVFRKLMHTTPRQYRLQAAKRQSEKPAWTQLDTAP